MSPRSARLSKREDVYNFNMSSATERVKKARALNCSLSYLGINGYSCKRLLSTKLWLLTKVA